MILLQILLMPVAEHRSSLFFCFLGKQRQVQSERGDPMALSLFALKTWKKRAPVLLSIGSGLLSVLTVHSLLIFHSGHLRWSKSESSVCHPCSQPNLGRWNWIYWKSGQSCEEHTNTSWWEKYQINCYAVNWKWRVSMLILDLSFWMPCSIKTTFCSSHFTTGLTLFCFSLTFCVPFSGKIGVNDSFVPSQRD